PGVGWDAVRSLVDSDRVRLAEAALGALVHTDRPAEALPILLAQAGDDRARVGMYAASRAARHVRPSELLPILSGIGLAAPGEGVKVTSRKEALRLLTALAVPDGPVVLAQAWRREGQHRDVRAAVVSAARQR